MNNYQNFFSINQQLTSVDLCSSYNINGAYYNGQFNDGRGATLTAPADSYGRYSIDGQNVELYQRILLPNQNFSNQNGIYEITSITDNVIFSRSKDFQSKIQINKGFYVFINSGNVLKSSSFILTDIPSRLGIDPLYFYSTDIRSGITDAWEGGDISNIFNVAGILADDIVICSINSSTNLVEILSVSISDNFLFVIYSGDPGPNTRLFWLAGLNRG